MPAPYAAAGRTELVGVADIVVGQRGGSWPTSTARTPYGSVTELLAAADPDLVSVTTPPGSHAEIAIEVLAAGKSVLLEKPPVLSLAEMDAVAAAERDSEGSVYVVFQHRHGSGGRRAAADCWPTARSARRRSRSARRCGSGRVSYFDPEWRGTWVGEGGGPTLGHGIHQIDLLLHLLGPWRTITATAVRLDRPVEFEDVSMASVIFESGAVATVINSLLSPHELSRIRIDTTGGSLEVNHLYGYSDADWTFTPVPDPRALRHRGRSRRSSYGASRSPRRSTRGPPPRATTYRAITRPRSPGWSTTCCAGRTHDTTLASTRPTMEFVTALYASALTGQPDPPRRPDPQLTRSTKLSTATSRSPRSTRRCRTDNGSPVRRAPA